MGLISFFRNKFNKNIVLKGDISNHLVYSYKLKQNKIWFDTKLKVPENYAFVIGKAGRALDCFPSGDFDVKAIYLPMCVKKFHLDRQQKDGSFLHSFVADAYFVNLNLFEYEKWKTYRKIEMFDEKYGYYNFSLQGAFAFKVTDVKKFMTALLKVYDYLKQGEATGILQGFVAEYVLGFFDKNKIVYDEVRNIDLLTDKLFENMEKQFEGIGVDIAGFVVEKIKFSKGFERYIRNIITDEKLSLESQALKSQAVHNQTVQNQTIQNQAVHNQTVYNQQSAFNANVSKPVAKSITQTYFQTQEQKIESDEIVDLIAVSSYNNDSESVRCVFCGAKNSSDSQVCRLCGENLKHGNK